jgi:hypothetical protein
MKPRIGRVPGMRRRASPSAAGAARTAGMTTTVAPACRLFCRALQRRLDQPDRQQRRALSRPA